MLPNRCGREGGSRRYAHHAEEGGRQISHALRWRSEQESKQLDQKRIQRRDGQRAGVDQKVRNMQTRLRIRLFMISSVYRTISGLRFRESRPHLHPSVTDDCALHSVCERKHPGSGRN